MCDRVSEREREQGVREGVESVCSLYLREGERKRGGGWMRKGYKYLQSSTYNKHSANREVNKTLLSEKRGERERVSFLYSRERQRRRELTRKSVKGKGRWKNE